MIFFHDTTTSVYILGDYNIHIKKEIKSFVFKCFFNCFVGVLDRGVKPLGERSSFTGDTAARFDVGTFPELGKQNKLDDYNE